MSPRTRSGNRRTSTSGPPLASTSKLLVEDSGDPLSPEDSDEDDTNILTSSIKKSLSTALAGLKRLQKEDEVLRKENKELKGRLGTKERDVPPKHGKKASQAVDGLQRQVKSLEDEIKALQKTQEKDKKKIRQLQIKEAKRDAAELEDDARDEAEDSAHFFRKLLRRFSNLVSANSLEGGEECPICMEALEVEKATSFLCQHVVCIECFRGLANLEGLLKCPACRQECSVEDIEVIRYTASSQWDALLDVAAQFTKVDRRVNDDIITSGDEGTEEPFIENDELESRSLSSPVATHSPPLQNTPEPELEQESLEQSQETRLSQRRRNLILSPATSPEPQVKNSSNRATSPLTELSQESKTIGTVPRTPEPKEPRFAEFSTAEKRKRLQELAEVQSQKRQRL